MDHRTPPSSLLRALIGGLALTMPSVAVADDALTTVHQFDATALEAPESIAADWDGNLYVSLAITGEIAKIDRDGVRSTLAFIPLGAYPAQECAPGDFALLHGIATDLDGNVYAGAAACDPGARGIWRVTPGGTATRIASLPPDAHPNGLAVRRGHVYVSDHFGGRIFRAPLANQGGPAELWVSSPLLAFVPNPFLAPGANGIQFFRNTAFVANSSQQTILAIDLGPHDQPGEPYVVHDVPPGCDDFAFDVLGNLYCTTNPFQTVTRIDPDGQVEVLFDAADGLDGPTSVTFGRMQDHSTLYIANAAFPFFPGTGHGPSVLAIELGHPGYPLR